MRRKQSARPIIDLSLATALRSLSLRRNHLADKSSRPVLATGTFKRRKREDARMGNSRTSLFRQTG